MASVSDIQDISKMKVTEIKKELKSRGLSTAGTKTELVERLKASSCEVAQDDASEDGNAESEILDEDEVLGVGGDEEEGGDFDDDDLAADAVLADEPKLQSSPATNPAKRPAPLSTEQSQEVQPKKRILVRPSSVSCEKENGSDEKVIKIDSNEEKADGKKVIKLSGLTLKDRLELRAQKFGVPLPEAAKKEARAARFGVPGSDTSKLAMSTKIEVLKPSEELLKKRAERFGANVSTLAKKMEEVDKKEQRKERFGTPAASVDSLEEKKRLRAERFKI